MNKKKIVALAMVLCMVAVLAIGGTLAYFQDYDYNTNVMMVGNVKIDQLEKDEEGNPYQDGLPMLPVVVDENGNMNYNNVIDKFVSVKNNGTSDAFIRTLFAFEMGKVWNEETQQDELVSLEHDYVGIMVEENTRFGMDFGPEESPLIIEIQGVPYKVATFYYDGNYATDTEDTKSSALEPGVESYPSLQRVFLHSHVGNEFYDMIAGNAADENERAEYNILVLSQAVQTEGFENAEEALNIAFGYPADIHPDSPEGYTNAQVWFDAYYNEVDPSDWNKKYNHSFGESDDEYDVFPEDPQYPGAA